MRTHLALGLGAALMYFFDPNRGRRRRTLVRDQLAHAVRVLADGKAVAAREPDERGGTRVDIQLEYVPIAGAVGHSIAKLFGRDPKSEIDADMIRVKTLIETGRQPRDAAERAHA